MADTTPIGKIHSIDGDGTALLIRSSGEQVVPKPGDVVFEGDTLQANQVSVVLQLPDNAGLQISAGELVTLHQSLLDSLAGLLANSSPENPVSAGTPSTPTTPEPPSSGPESGGSQSGINEQVAGSGNSQSNTGGPGTTTQTSQPGSAPELPSASIPEPTALPLLAGLLLMMALRKRWKRQAR